MRLTTAFLVVSLALAMGVYANPEMHDQFSTDDTKSLRTTLVSFQRDGLPVALRAGATRRVPAEAAAARRRSADGTDDGGAEGPAPPRDHLEHLEISVRLHEEVEAAAGADDSGSGSGSVEETVWRTRVLDVSLHRKLFGPAFRTARVGKGGALLSERPGVRELCQYKGKVRGEEDSAVFVSTCRGLRGQVRIGSAHWLLEPLPAAAAASEGGVGGELVRVFKWHEVMPTPDEHHTCGVEATAPQEGEQGRGRRGQGAETTVVVEAEDKGQDGQDGRLMASSTDGSTAAERAGGRTAPNADGRYPLFPELAFVTDATVRARFGDDLDDWVAAMMADVAAILDRLGLGLELTFVEHLEVDAEAFEQDASDASELLDGFSSFMAARNPDGDTDPLHYDGALYFTMDDLCVGVESCSTIGLASTSAQCSPTRAFGIVEVVQSQNMFLVATTAAHEYGHVLGLFHDDDGACADDRGFVMSAVAGSATRDWSECSKAALGERIAVTDFTCMLDEPADPADDVPPLAGQVLSLDQQCLATFGRPHQTGGDLDALASSGFRRCGNSASFLCTALTCGTGSADFACHSDNWLDGTPCSTDGTQVCKAGACVAKEVAEAPVDGGWSEWADFSECSVPCGGGERRAWRFCDSPVPERGGADCAGPQVRREACNTDACASGNVRADQCEAIESFCCFGGNVLNDFTVGPATFQDQPVCILWCRHDVAPTTVFNSGLAADGTPCVLDGEPDARCVGGSCVAAAYGCDNVLNSGVVSDACGVCNGDGSSCIVVDKEGSLDVNAVDFFAEFEAGVEDVTVELRAGSADLDLRIKYDDVPAHGFTQDNGAPVTGSEQGMEINYSGFSGFGGNLGDEFFRVTGASTVKITVEIFAFQSGDFTASATAVDPSVAQPCDGVTCTDDPDDCVFTRCVGGACEDRDALIGSRCGANGSSMCDGSGVCEGDDNETDGGDEPPAVPTGFQVRHSGGGFGTQAGDGLVFDVSFEGNLVAPAQVTDSVDACAALVTATNAFSEGFVFHLETGLCSVIREFSRKADSTAAEFSYVRTDFPSYPALDGFTLTHSGAALAGGDDERFGFGNSARRFAGTKSAQACANVAANDVEATGFLHRPSSNACFVLHTLSTKASATMVAASYAKDAAGPSPPARFDLVGTGGSNIGGDGVRFGYGKSARRRFQKNLDFDQCAQLADDDPAAVGFLYRPNVRRCYTLHDAVARGTTSTYAVSYKASAQPNTQGFVLQHTGATSRGGDGRKLSTSSSRLLSATSGLSLEQCAANALALDNCAGFSYSVPSQKCYLVKRADSRGTTGHLVGYVRDSPAGFRLVHTGLKDLGGGPGNGKRWDTRPDRRSSAPIEADQAQCAEHCNSEAGQVDGECVGFATRETTAGVITCFALQSLSALTLSPDNTNHFLSYSRA